jgi:acetylornithine/succinyldiaminopimelate/putrescine aminotransferase
MTSDVHALVRRHALTDPAPLGPAVRRLAGARLEALDGSRWLDGATGGFGCGHPALEAAIAAQLERVALSSRFLISSELAQAVAAIDRWCAGPLTVSYLCSSGAEALDAALKLAKGTHPRRRRVLGLAGEEHGTFTHGQTLGGRRSPLPEPALHATAVPAADPDQLLARVDRSVAAVVIAPAAPGRSLAALEPAFWTQLRRRCDRSRTLLVLDERLTAPARLGTSLGAERIGIDPDVLVLGDSLGGDVVPVGATVMTRRAYDRVYARRNPSLHGSTFGSSPLAAAAVTAVLEAAGPELARRQAAVEELAHRALARVTGPGLPLRRYGADGSLVWLRAASPALAQRLVEELARERVLVRPPRGAVVSVLAPLTAEPADAAALVTRTAAAAGRLGSWAKEAA